MDRLQIVPRRGPARGIVLPVVLVLLVAVTVVTLYVIRRGKVDERLAANVRATVTLDTAATYALRYCERWVLLSPPGLEPLPGRPTPPRAVAAPPATATAPAWRDAALWSQAVTLNTADLGPEVADARCLIEDATAELETAAESPATGNNNGLAFEGQFRKYRITVEVTGAGIWNPAVARAQSELRTVVSN
ncbi:MAG: hypothetical protein N2688_00635 [Burkholderiaceae bacterium]|nr:hypothetical protein [Burkholderiaceae bacterium]